MLELIRQAMALSGIAMAAIACPGCATGESPKMQDDVGSLKKQVWALEKRVSELSLQVSYQAGDIAQLKATAPVSSETAQPATATATATAPMEPGIDVRGDRTPEPVATPVEPEPVKVASLSTPTAAPEIVETTTEVVEAPAPEPVMVAANEKGDYADQSAEEVYRQATTAFNERDYGMAVTGFDYLIRAFPGHPLAPYSQYWIGESHYVQKRFPQAWEAFQTLLLRWPDAPKVADALLKSGLSKLAMGEQQDGVATLEKLIRDYPRTPAAYNARRTLDELVEKSNG